MSGAYTVTRVYLLGRGDKRVYLFGQGDKRVYLFGRRATLVAEEISSCR